MVHKTALTACLMVGSLWCLALVAGADDSPPAPAAGGFHPVASIDSLMHGQLGQFKAIKQLLSDPKAEKRAKRLLHRAELLAELANVNIHNKDKPDYKQWATQLRETALELSREAKKKAGADENKMVALFQKLKKTCGACHDVYQ